jgi:hypothetical protein
MNPVLEYHLSAFIPARQFAAMKVMMPHVFEGSRTLEDPVTVGTGFHTFAGDFNAVTRIASLVEVNRKRPISDDMIKYLLGET